MSLIRDFLILGNSVEIKQQYMGLINLRSNLINGPRSDVITEMPENAVHLMVAKRGSIPPMIKCPVSQQKFTITAC